MANPIAARRAEPIYQSFDKQSRCDDLNREELTHKMGRFFYVKETESKTTGEILESIEWMEIPNGTKAWIRENAARVKGLIRSITGGNPALIEEVYQRALNAAPSPKAWSNKAG